jgi:adenosylmethionine-8-amino-7-oxononanoate aminotransferase
MMDQSPARSGRLDVDSLPPTSSEPAPWPLLPSSQPVHYVRAKQALLYTPEGRAVIDAASGAVVVNLGHGRADLARVASETLLRLTFAHPEEVTPARLELLEELKRHWLPEGFERMMFTTGGSEAIEAASKAAIHYHAGRRKQIVAQAIGYHGATYLSYSLSNTDRVAPELRERLLPVPRIASADGRSADRLFASFVETIERLGPDQVAAIVAEPIVGSSGGVLLPPTGYWDRVRSYCTDHDILLVFDEVMTGFGRTGRRFAFEHETSSTPDILVAGKGLGCGYAPICGVFFAQHVGERLLARKTAIMTPTYAAHETSCAIAKAALSILRRERLLPRVRRLGARLGRALARTADLPCVTAVRGVGLFWAIEIDGPDQRALLGQVLDRMQALGVSAYPSGRSGPRPAVLIAPPFVTEEEQIDQIADAAFTALSEVSC